MNGFSGPGKRIGNGDGTVKIWCLGDSETHGYIPPLPGTYTGSYRKALYQALTAAGYTVDMLGTITNASDGVTGAGYGHDGINGASPLGWRDSYFPDRAPTVNAQGVPDLVVILLGANGADNDTQAGLVYDTVNLAIDMWPKASIGLMTMFPIEGVSFATFNAGLKLRAAKNPSVFIINQAGAVPIATYGSDGLHLTAAGYVKLADAPINAILQRL